MCGQNTFLELGLKSIKSSSLETAVRESHDNLGSKKTPNVFMVVDLPGKMFPSYFRTKGKKLVQNTPTTSGNNF